MLTKNVNSSLVNADPLSEIITCRYLLVVNQCCNALIVNLELVLFTGMISNQFEKESRSIKNNCPWNRPV